MVGKYEIMCLSKLQPYYISYSDLIYKTRLKRQPLPAIAN